MDFISSIGNQLVSNFDFVYIIVINVLTYLAIKMFDFANKDKEVNTWTKRFILCIMIFIVTVVYIICDYQNKIILLNSAIVTPVSWSWVFKPILKKLGIDYNKIDKTLNYE